MKQHKRKKTREQTADGASALLRVKFFSFKSNMLLDGRAINGALPSEHAVNEWPAKNPGIRIVEIRQSMCQMLKDNFATTLITVWYEGGPAARTAASTGPGRSTPRRGSRADSRPAIRRPGRSATGIRRNARRRTTAGILTGDPDDVPSGNGMMTVVLSLPQPAAAGKNGRGPTWRLQSPTTTTIRG